MAKKLKVFRTPIGFHDAYVAAPSQKAALEAWGAGTDLFGAGAAELVTDPKLTKEPLAHPGEVIRKVRGSAEEHVRALGDKPKARKSRTEPAEPKKKRAPRPSRSLVDKAEKALEAAETRHREASAKLQTELDRLEKRRRDLEGKQREERDQLQAKVAEARKRYRAAMADWAE
jgi:hypothetical protein